MDNDRATPHAPALRESPGPNRPTGIRILTPGPHPARTHAELLAPKNTDRGAVFIVDQFEEAFTLCTDTAERARFVELLLAATDPDRGARVVVAPGGAEAPAPSPDPASPSGGRSAAKAPSIPQERSPSDAGRAPRQFRPPAPGRSMPPATVRAWDVAGRARADAPPGAAGPPTGQAGDQPARTRQPPHPRQGTLSPCSGG
ncbi:hypothetical protein [Streptomyces sp. NRRL S-495]|uniref:nSTAND1 domain-containing NTPase n=1 Tax=Streptomyces sp. NRRL S-495 TaxID=1609133 RepID=UPI00336AD637